MSNKTTINGLYRDYFQKSRIFLYPALGIVRGGGFAPLQTYISWEGIRSRDRRLICLYLLDHKEVTTDADRNLKKRVFQREEIAFRGFERVKLSGNRLFDRKVNLGEQLLPEGVVLKYPGVVHQGVYIFNFEEHVMDWSLFLQGRYSKISDVVKNKIKDFFVPTKTNPSDNYGFIESFLHPERYYSIYSELLGVSVHVLKEAQELTDKPDLDRETLKTSTNLNKIIK